MTGVVWLSSNLALIAAAIWTTAAPAAVARTILAGAGIALGATSVTTAVVTAVALMTAAGAALPVAVF